MLNDRLSAEINFSKLTAAKTGKKEGESSDQNDKNVSKTKSSNRKSVKDTQT